MRPEVYCYLASILLVWISLTATFKENLIKKYPHFPFIASCITVMGLVLTGMIYFFIFSKTHIISEFLVSFVDMIVPLYHSTATQTILRPAYESYILFIIYIFLPLSKNSYCIILGMITTICYLIEMIMITYPRDEMKWWKTITELIFLFCVNFFGFYFRLMNEVAIRRAFLDRRECVEGNILLKFARDQEVFPTYIPKINKKK